MSDVRRRAWARWLSAGGPWQGWSVCPLLSVPDLDGVTPRAFAQSGDAASITRELAELLTRWDGVALALSLQPALGVQVAAQLNHRGMAHPVLVLPRWPYAEAVLPVDTLVGCLIAEARWLNASQERLANVALVLDAEHDLPIRRRSASDPRADNRYRLSIGDLPNLADLRAGGIRRVVKVSSA